MDQITLTADLAELRRRITGLENFAAGAGYPGPADAAALLHRIEALERFEQRIAAIEVETADMIGKAANRGEAKDVPKKK
jgi:hypothetical protein